MTQCHKKIKNTDTQSYKNIYSCKFDKLFVSVRKLMDICV